LSHRKPALVALLEGEVKPALTTGGGARVGVVDPARHLPGWRDVVKRLRTPFHPGWMGRERRVIDAERTRDGIDTGVDIVREHRHGGEGTRRSRAPGRDQECVVE